MWQYLERAWSTAVSGVGVEASGTVYRMDGVPLEAKTLVKPPEGVKTDVEILTFLLERVKKLKEG